MTIAKPIILISGDHGVGKSHVANLITTYVRSALSLNKYDFLTRKLLFILGISPVSVGYTLIHNNMIDKTLYQTDTSMLYVQSEVQRKQLVDRELFTYFVKYALGVKLSGISDAVIADIIAQLNAILSQRRKHAQKGAIYKLTVDIFDRIICRRYNWDNYAHVESYLNSRFIEFKAIYDEWKHRVIYFAYSKNEVNYFKTNFDCVDIFIDMSHVYQSQMLLKNVRHDTLAYVINSDRKREVHDMKTSAEIVIRNDMEMDANIISKLMNAINLD